MVCGAALFSGAVACDLIGVAGLGDAGKERVSFASVRLTAHKQRQTVLRVRVPKGEGKPSDTWAELEPMPNGTINALLRTAPASTLRPAAAAFVPASTMWSAPRGTRPLTDEERELAELEASMAM